MTPDLARTRPDEQPPRSVLVVEDDVLLRLDATEGLRLEGFVVYETASAEDALSLFASGFRADVVFSDLQLAGQATGWDLRLALADSHPDVGFILTSGQEPPRDAKTQGVQFLPKPYGIGRVANAIAKEIERQNDGIGRDDGSP